MTLPLHKRPLNCVIILLLVLTASSAVFSQTTFSKLYDIGRHGSRAHGVTSDLSGNIYMVGDAYRADTTFAVPLYISKLLPNGVITQVQYYTIPATNIGTGLPEDPWIFRDTLFYNISPWFGRTRGTRLLKYDPSDFMLYSDDRNVIVNDLGHRHVLDLHTAANKWNDIATAQITWSRVTDNAMYKATIVSNEGVYEFRSALNDSLWKVSTACEWSDDETVIMAGYSQSILDVFYDRFDNRFDDFIELYEFDKQCRILRHKVFDDFSVIEGWKGQEFEVQDMVVMDDGSVLFTTLMFYPHHIGVLEQENLVHRPIAVKLNTDWEIAWISDFGIENWQKGAYNMPQSIVRSTSDIGYLTLIVHSDFDFVKDDPNEIEQNISGMLIHIDDEGDVLWKRHYQYEHPDTTIAYRLYELEPHPDGGYLLAGRIGFGYESYVEGGDSIFTRSWLLKVDEHGCLVPGCQDINTSTVDSEDDADIFTVYPNPVASQLYISDPEAHTTDVYRLTDAQGRLVHSFHPDRSGLSSIVVNMTALTSGVYFISKLSSAGQVLATKKVVKE